MKDQLQPPTTTLDLAHMMLSPDTVRGLSLRPSRESNAVIVELVSSDSLPDVPEDLRTHIAAYIQRGRELSSKDPIMCYWCLYFATKRGVSARTGNQWLFKLMSVLERVKKELKDDEAILTEQAGYAYIESFALKVFQLADAEDQAGQATKSTAKKFLAAANFLEMLSVFDIAKESKENSDKVKYAKWKASSIARDIRTDEVRPSGQYSRNKAPPLSANVTGSSSSSGTSKPPSPELAATTSPRHLAPPTPRNTISPVPSVPSSFGSLPPSTTPSPASETRVNPLSSSSATSSQPLHQPIKPSGQQPLPPFVSKTITDSTPILITPVPPSSRPSLMTTFTKSRKTPAEELPSPSKQGFFAAIAGRMFNGGSKDGQTWSTTTTPGTEDGSFRLPVILAGREKETREREAAKDKTSSPLRATPISGTSTTTVEASRPSQVQSLSRRPDPSSSRGMLPSAVASLEGTRPAGRSQTVSGRQRSHSASASAPGPVTPIMPLKQTSDEMLKTKNAQNPSRSNTTPSSNVRVGQPKAGFSEPNTPHPSNPNARPYPITARIAALKKVHFTESVVGGLSSVASTSPPGSPVVEVNMSFPAGKASNREEVRLLPPSQPAESGRRQRPLSMSMLEPKAPLTMTTMTPPVNAKTLQPYPPQSGSSSRMASVSSLAAQPSRSPGLAAQPIPVPGRARSQSFGQPSSAGGSLGSSLRSLTTPESTAPAPVRSGSGGTSSSHVQTSHPVNIPNTSNSKASSSVVQQPTPSPSPPKHLQGQGGNKSTSPLPMSYVVVNPATGIASSPRGVSNMPSNIASSLSHSIASAQRQLEGGGMNGTGTHLARKYTESAKSALQMNDVEAAKRELRRALNLLEAK